MNRSYEGFFELHGQLECPLTIEDCDIILQVCGSFYWWEYTTDREYAVMKAAEIINTKPADKQNAIHIAMAIARR